MSKKEYDPGLYKEKFKQRELENELQHEDEDEWSRLTPEEARKRANEEAESYALRSSHRTRYGI